MNGNSSHKRLTRIICLVFALIFAFSTVASIVLSVMYAAA